MDAWCCAPLPLFSLISTDIHELPAEVKNNSIILSTLRICCDITKYIGQRDFSSVLQPLILNVSSPPGIGISIFDDWYSKELRFVSDSF